MIFKIIFKAFNNSLIFYNIYYAIINKIINFIFEKQFNNFNFLIIEINLILLLFVELILFDFLLTILISVICNCNHEFS